MMITRFNAGCKERLEGKGKFSEKERVAIGSASMTGIPCRIAEKQFDVGRAYDHELGKKAGCALENLRASEQTTEAVIVPNKAFRERLVASLTRPGMPAANIAALAEDVFSHSISGGTIWNMRKEASRKAETPEKSASPENIKHIAADEAFQNGEPVPAGADLDGGCVFLTEAAPDRSGETWKAAFEEKKARGLKPELNVGDGGSGPVKGVREAFPEIETQPDIFRAPRDLGNAVRSAEQAEIRRLSKLCDLEYRIQTAKTYLPAKREYDLMRRNTPLRLLQSDALRILFDRLVEHTASGGCGYRDSLELCGRILDETALLCPKRDSLRQQIRRFRGRLSDLLAFLPRLWRETEAAASLFHAREDAFALLCLRRARGYRGEECRFPEKKPHHIFGERLPEARETLKGMFAHICRASGSPDENVNGRLRVFTNAGRGVPVRQLPLCRMFLNMKRAKRSRRPERIGTSALERPAGRSHPNFLDALLGSPNYILSAR